jgi:hypothetical protein
MSDNNKLNLFTGIKQRYLSRFSWRRSFFISAILIGLTIITSSCFTIKYSTTGASISPEIKTLSIQLFQNRAPKGPPTLSQQFTDKLRDKCRANTSLTILTDGGETSFEGEIVDYDTKPIAISNVQGSDVAAKNRLTITVHVKFTNTVDPKFNFDTNFSRFQDYDSSKDLLTVADALEKLIIDDLTEDIFNKAFVNW